MIRSWSANWEDSYTGVGRLREHTTATRGDVPLHPGAERSYQGRQRTTPRLKYGIRLAPAVAVSYRDASVSARRYE